MEFEVYKSLVAGRGMLLVTDIGHVRIKPKCRCMQFLPPTDVSMLVGKVRETQQGRMGDYLYFAMYLEGKGYFQLIWECVCESASVQVTVRKYE
jgi:hypothetical protein